MTADEAADLMAQLGVAVDRARQRRKATNSSAVDVETVPCTFCDDEIVPEVEDGDTAFDCQCCSNGWHHYDCAHNCSAYLTDLNDEQALDAAMDARYDA